MKRLSLLFAAMLVAALVVPGLAMATEPVYLNPWDAPDPVPANTPLVVPAGWITMTRGLAMSAPTCNKFYFTVWDDQDNVVVQCTTAQSDDYWLPPVLVTADWSGMVPFNSHIGAKQYLRPWRYPIAEGLPAGEYRMTAGGVQTRVAFDLYWYFDGQRSPLRFDAGEFVVYEDWEFTVQ